jgi:hypothetical protein
MATTSKQTIGEIDVVVFTKAVDKDETLTRDLARTEGSANGPWAPRAPSSATTATTR